LTEKISVRNCASRGIGCLSHFIDPLSAGFQRKELLSLFISRQRNLPSAAQKEHSDQTEEKEPHPSNIGLRAVACEKLSEPGKKPLFWAFLRRGESFVGAHLLKEFFFGS
jgi:hypothetical protein